jgi:hypothetical protein
VAEWRRQGEDTSKSKNGHLLWILPDVSAEMIEERCCVYAARESDVKKQNIDQKRMNERLMDNDNKTDFLGSLNHFPPYKKFEISNVFYI